MTNKQLEKLINAKIPVELSGVDYQYVGGLYTPVQREKPIDLAEIITRVIINKEQTIFKGGKRVQCESGRRRSIVDTYRVAKTYIPTIKYEDVVKAVRSLYRVYDGWKSSTRESSKESYVAKTGAGILCASFCFDTQRVVHDSANLLKSNLNGIRQALETRKLNKKCTKQEKRSKR